jgi:MFS family permease
MLETYALLAAFTAQILTLSVLAPIWHSRQVRAQAANIPTERFAQVGVDYPRERERLLTRYRVLNGVAVVLGLLLLGWLFNFTTQHPDWEKGSVQTVLSLYFLVQVYPSVFFRLRQSRMLKRLAPEKRTAVLRRRELFDFVSPAVVFLAVLVYLLYAAFVIYVGQVHPFPEFRGLSYLIGITLFYAFTAFMVYSKLYGRRENPLETHEDRLERIGLGVKVNIGVCIAIVVYESLKLTLRLLDLARWEPFAFSISFVILVFVSVRLLAPPRWPRSDDAFATKVQS